LAFKNSNSFCMLLTVLSILLIFVMSFEPLWKIVPSIFYNIQFPWRLLLILAVFVSLLIPTCLEKLSSSWYYIAIVLCIVFSLPLLYKLSTRIYHYDYSVVDLDAGLGNLKEYYPSEYLQYPEYYDFKNGINLIEGSANISVIEDNPEKNKLVFSIDDSKQSILEFPRIYYKGYHLTDQNGKVIPLDRSSYGFLCAPLGDGIYTLTYSGTFLFRIFSIIRICFVIILGGYCIFRLLYKKLVRSSFI